MHRKCFSEIMSDLDKKTDKKLAAKLPSLAGIRIPTGLALEQCSSEAAAIHKAGFALRLLCGIAPGGGCEAKGDKQYSSCKVADLTGGLGIDCWAFSHVFEKVLHNEMNPLLSAAVQENFQSLGIGNVEFSGFEITVGHSGWESHIGSFGPDVIYLDPARRSASGKKVFLLEECSPNVLELLPTLLSLSPIILLKLSPMADISLVRQRVSDRCRESSGRSCLREIQAVGLDGECKELLCALDRNWDGGCTISAATLSRDGNVAAECKKTGTNRGDSPFRIADADELVAGKLLLCPDAVLLKAGLQDTLCKSADISKLDRFTHLYLCDEDVSDTAAGFCSRNRIIELLPFCNKSFTELGSRYSRMDVTARNLPVSSEELKTRIFGKKGNEGNGNGHIWAFSTPHGRFLAVCDKI